MSVCIISYNKECVLFHMITSACTISYNNECIYENLKQRVYVLLDITTVPSCPRAQWRNTAGVCAYPAMLHPRKRMGIANTNFL